MLKAAIIGAGFISEYHGEGYRLLDSVKLCAVCDVDAAKAEALAQKMDCKAYTDARQMLAEVRPELVSICLPTFLHEEYTLLALEYGANVLCEKPLSLTMESCERMAEAARQAGKMLMTAQVLRWWPEYQTIRENLRRMGNPFAVSTKRLQYSGRTTWLSDPWKGGGVLFDLFVHDLDYLCSLFGTNPAVKTAYGTKGKEGSWRSLCAVLEWGCGVHAKIEASNLMPLKFPFTAGLRADYPDKCLLYSFRAPVNIQKDAKTTTEFLLFENGEVSPLPYPQGAQSLAFDEEIKAFVQGVETGISPLPIEETLSVMKLIHTVKQRLEAGE